MKGISKGLHYNFFIAGVTAVKAKNVCDH